LKAIAISPTTSSSATASAAYTFNYPLAATPTFSPVAGTYASDQSIALTTTTPNATIYYTTNNTTPTSSSAVYSTPISIAGHGTSMVIQAKAISATTSLSSAASGTFTIAYPAAATPTFNPPGGVYTSTQSVTISSTTAGATIWYTTDGSDPTSSATRLSGASPVASVSAPLGKTLRAEATAIGYSTSAEGTANYQPPLLTMLPVAGGSFNNGTSLVTVSSFTMSKYEITQNQYAIVTGSSPSSFSTVTGGPVDTVTWFDAVEFCNKLSTRESRTPVYTISGRTPATGYPITSASVTATWTNNGYRLPTEAEWEYAARGGASTHGYVYAGSSTIDGVAWYSTNSASKTHAVGGKTANELGLYDMSGNLWEWCWDWYGAYPSGTQTNPTGATTGSYRVKRGGGWDNSTSICTVSIRNDYYPYYRSNLFGFRVVAPPSP
jgi:formylglycine-generating enzyme required for sulfatase activity